MSLFKCLIPYAYQPIYKLSDGTVLGYEALMRPENETPETYMNGVLRPNGTIDTHKLECTTVFSSMYHFGDLKGLLFVNTFPNECLYDDEFSELKALFGKNMFERLVVEMLEYPEFNSNAWIRKSRQIEEVGCLLAIDDYGTGINDLEMVKRLDPDIVKFDQSFVAAARNDRALEEQFHRYGDEITARGMEVVVEGVETEADDNLVKMSSAAYGQGYYYSKPLLVTA